MADGATLLSADAAGAFVVCDDVTYVYDDVTCVYDDVTYVMPLEPLWCVCVCVFYLCLCVFC